MGRWPGQSRRRRADQSPFTPRHSPIIGLQQRRAATLLHPFVVIPRLRRRGSKSCLKALYQMLFVEWLAQETYRAGLKDARGPFLRKTL
jgi:hypothetical protein